MDTNTPEVIYIAEKVGPVWRGLVIDQRTHEAVARTATYASAETAKSAAASMWRAKMAGGYRVLHVTATGEQAVHTFAAGSLAEAAGEAIKPKYYRPWCATVLIDDVSSQRYSYRDCEQLAAQAEVAA